MRTPALDLIQAAQESDRRWGVFASVTLGQGILESAWFTKATGRFNFFGIKALPGEPQTVCWTHEEIGGRLVAVQQNFRNFSTVAEAFDAHARLLALGAPYAQAMVHKSDLTAFVQLMAPHYATDPDYAEKLLTLIREEQLARFDATGSAPALPDAPHSISAA